MSDYSNVGAVCFDCARNAGFSPKKKAVGVWIGECDICHEEKQCTDLWHDWTQTKTGGSLRPLTSCDSDCALVNGCRIGGYQCARCGEWYCGSEINDDNLCVYCEEADAIENEEGDENGK